MVNGGRHRSDAARQKWSLTQEAFDGLLASIGLDRDDAANRYLEIRRNLVRLFEWRGCSTPDEYADETINRCARKIGEGEQIRDLATYSIGVARMLLREKSRERAREACSLDQVPEPKAPPAEPVSDQEPRTSVSAGAWPVSPGIVTLSFVTTMAKRARRSRPAKSLPNRSAFRQVRCGCERCGFEKRCSFAQRSVCSSRRQVYCDRFRDYASPL